MTPHAVIAPARLAGGCLMRAQSDERLVDLVRAGNERAFEAIVQRYRAPLLRHCRRLLKDGRAEDALQQALLRAHAAMQADDRPLHLRPWLFRIATNASLDALRQPGWSHEPLDPDVDGMDRPDQVAERHEDLRRALAAVCDLPRRQRDVIVLRELEGRSYEEIAQQLGVSGGAVRQLLHRGRAGLRSAASAVTPLWVVMRVGVTAPAGESANRIAELAAGAGGAAGLTKGLATVLAAGTVAGGVAVAPIGDHGLLGSAASSVEHRAGSLVEEAPAAVADPVAPARGEGPSVEVSGPGGGDEDRSGPNRGGGEDDDGDDRSGPSGGDDRPDDDSGRRRNRGGGGSGEVEPDGDLDDDDGGRSGGGPGPSDQTATNVDADPTTDGSNSGPGSTSDNSGSGSTSDSSGSGSTSDNSGSGSTSDGSGSGSSGSGSG